MWEIEYFTTAAGECPTKEFLDGLNKKGELPYAMRELALLEEFGYQLRRPHAAPLRDGIFELRIRVRHQQYRLLYFFFFHDRIVLCHGFRKESDKVPDFEIDKALRYRTHYFSTHERMK